MPNYLKDNNYNHSQVIALPIESVFITFEEFKKLRERHDEIEKADLELLTVVTEKIDTLYKVIDNFELYYKRSCIQKVKTLHCVVI